MLWHSSKRIERRSAERKSKGMEGKEDRDNGSAGITRLRSEIRFLEERLAANGSDNEPLSEHAARIVRGDLARLQEQFERMIKASPK